MSGHPMPAEAAINAELSNYAVALFYGNNDLVANRIAPVIPVVKNPGDYHVLLPIEGKNLNHETRIPHGGVATELNFRLDKATYSTEQYGKRHFLSDREAKMSAVSVLEYRRGVDLILENLALDREATVAEILLTEASYYVDADDPHWFRAETPWTDDSANPYHDIKAARRAVALHSGRTANTLLLSPKASDALVDNPTMIDILKTMYGLTYIQTGKFPNPLFGLQVIIAGATFDQNPPLETASLKFLWETIGEASDDWAWVGYVDPSASLMTSAMVVQFAFNNQVISDRDIVTVKEKYDQFPEGTWYEARTDYEVKLSNGRAGAVITDLVSGS